MEDAVELVDSVLLVLDGIRTGVTTTSHCSSKASWCTSQMLCKTQHAIMALHK